MTEKTSIDDIIGIVKTNEPTDSVEEIRKLRGRDKKTEKRFNIVHLRDLCVCDIQDTAQDVPTFYNDLTWNMGSAIQICDLLNELNEENEQLKKDVEYWKTLAESLAKNNGKLEAIQ